MIAVELEKLLNSLHANNYGFSHLPVRIFEGLNQQGQGQGLSLQGPGQGPGLDLQGHVLTSLGSVVMRLRCGQISIGDCIANVLLRLI